MLSEDIAGTNLGSCRICIKYIRNIENFVITKVKKPKLLSTVSRLVYILLYLLCLLYFIFLYHISSRFTRTLVGSDSHD